LIQTKESRKQAPGQNKVEGIAFPAVCASFLAEDSSLLPYLAWSNLFFILLFSYLFINKQLLFPIEPDRTKQAINIELVSAADFQNKNDLLPSTIPKPSLGKRVSPLDEVILPRTSVPVEAAKTQPSKSQYKEFAYAINCRQHACADAFNSVTRLPVKSCRGGTIINSSGGSSFASSEPPPGAQNTGAIGRVYCAYTAPLHRPYPRFNRQYHHRLKWN